MRLSCFTSANASTMIGSAKPLASFAWMRLICGPRHPVGVAAARTAEVGTCERRKRKKKEEMK